MAESLLEAHYCEDFGTPEPLIEALEPFNCSICLELVYKPVVQACGHIFCFWCACNAMDIQKESQCPMCRHPYMYFPRVCKLLHFMLIKAVPEEYERRGHEIQCEEEAQQVFSPSFLPKNLWISRKFNDDVGSHSQKSDASNYAVATSNFSASIDNIDRHYILGSPQNDNLECAQKDAGCAPRNTDSVLGILTTDDFCCALCNGLLYRPVVLNCGEVFCESCLKKIDFKVLHCPSCKASHPGGSVLICLALHQYLESAFPTAYLRKQLQQQAENIQFVGCNTADVGDCKSEGYLHEGIGCDGCGMFPIIGSRYRCEECTEKVGFDLCGSCYTKGGSLTGRFNQEHQSNHHMEQVIFAHQDYQMLLPTATDDL